MAYEKGDTYRAKILTNGKSKTSTELISVLSTKGGVGKTLVAIGLAWIANSKGRVCLIDLDFSGPSLEYMIGNDRSKDQISLNEYLWAKLFPVVKESTKQEVFKGRYSWASYFESLSQFESEELLNRLLVGFPSKFMNGVSNIKFITSSRDTTLKDLMLPLLMSGEALEPLKDELWELCKVLHNAGFHEIIMDTPAELKDVAMCAASLSTAYGGKNVFVSTLFEPALRPLLHLLPLNYRTGRNYLVVNKLRALDQTYAKSQEALIDYLSSRKTVGDFFTGFYTSETMLSALLCLEEGGIKYLPWDESFERFLRIRSPKLSQSQFKYLSDILRDSLESILMD